MYTTRGEASEQGKEKNKKARKTSKQRKKAAQETKKEKGLRRGRKENRKVNLTAAVMQKRPEGRNLSLIIRCKMFENQWACCFLLPNRPDWRPSKEVDPSLAVADLDRLCKTFEVQHQCLISSDVDEAFSGFLYPIPIASSTRDLAHGRPREEKKQGESWRVMNRSFGSAH
jgi:hypothetical protein